MQRNIEEDEGLNALEMLGAVTLVAGTAVVLTIVIAPKTLAVITGGAAAALGGKLILLGMGAATGAP